MPEVKERLAPPDQTVDDGVLHSVCCRNEDLALCGFICTGPFHEVEDGRQCVVCLDLGAQHECPEFGMCADA
jgi:hypothetical protein